jgi:hypothetical protein
VNEVTIYTAPRVLGTIRLWSINRWLKYTGFRLFVATCDDRPTLIGVAWYGWSDL